MAEAKRETREVEVTERREVTTYTLTLSEAEVAAFKEECSQLPAPTYARCPTLVAIRTALTAPRLPLAKGDTIRLTRDNPRYANGEEHDWGSLGDLLKVHRAAPDGDNEFLAEFGNGDVMYLAASGTYAADWEVFRPRD